MSILLTMRTVEASPHPSAGQALYRDNLTAANKQARSLGTGRQEAFEAFFKAKAPLGCLHRWQLWANRQGEEALRRHSPPDGRLASR